MQWAGEACGGFSRTEPWLPMSSGFRREITVEAQQRDPDSILAFYKKLIAKRKQYRVIADGAISFLETGTDMVLAYRRTLEEQGLDVFCNLEEKEHPISLSGEQRGGQVLLTNYSPAESIEEALDGELYMMRPYELLVIALAIP